MNENRDELIHKTEDDIRNYRWMINEIERISSEIGDINAAISSYGERERKGAGLKNDVVGHTAIRRIKQISRMQYLEEIVKRVENAYNLSMTTMTEKELTILDCLLDGLSMREISLHMKISKTKSFQIKSNVIEIMSAKMHIKSANKTIGIKETNDTK